jgi:23S rRNA (uracil1939-C5)-methyltransferase
MSIPQKTDEMTLCIEKMTYGNAGLAHLAGKAVFVEGALVGDIVRAKIVQNRKHSIHASTTEILAPSLFRVSSTCKNESECKGCTWGCLDYSAQLSAKQQNIIESLSHIAGVAQRRAKSLVRPCLPSPQAWGYRNKLEMQGVLDPNGKIMIGFHPFGSFDDRSLVPLDFCPLAHREIAHDATALQGALRYLQGAKNKNGNFDIFRIGLRHSQKTGSLEIALWTCPGPLPRKAVATTLGSALHPTSIVRVIADKGKARKIKGFEVLSGSGYWKEHLNDYQLKVSAPSFAQVNTECAEVLINTVHENLDLDGRKQVADLYAGAGTFTIMLAKSGARVFAVESASNAVKDLRRNAEENKVEVDIVGGDAARELGKLNKMDAIVLDPPTSGIGKTMILAIKNTSPHQIAYVSCNPSTWARDVSRLAKIGYSLKKVVPVDMFPQTYHVELVSIFEKGHPCLKK